MSFQSHTGELFNKLPEDYLIFWENISLFDFAIYYLIIAQILQSYMLICIFLFGRKDNPKAYGFISLQDINQFLL